MTELESIELQGRRCKKNGKACEHVSRKWPRNMILLPPPLGKEAVPCRRTGSVEHGCNIIAEPHLRVYPPALLTIRKGLR